MKIKKISEDCGELSITKKEVKGIAKCIFFIEEIKKYRDQNPALFDELSKFLVKVRNEFFEITQ